MASATLITPVLLLLATHALAGIIDVPTDEEVCRRPQHRGKNCVMLCDCPSLIKLLEKKPVPQKHVEILNEARCGFQGAHPKVCCPPEDNELTTQRPPVVAPQPQVPESPKSYLLPDLKSCGIFPIDRVLYGDETQLDGYPWTVLLKYESPNGPGFHCGGVLINNRYVLTAAHCVAGRMIDNGWKLVGVRLGEYDIDSDPDCESFLFAQFDCCCTDPVVDVGIKKTIVHESYDPNNRSQHDDIALLRLDEEVQYTDFIKPICLQPFSQLSSNSVQNSSVVVSGWGVSDVKFNGHVKKSALLEIRNNTECETALSVFKLQLTDKQLCVFAKGKQNPCPLDSGGVLMNDAQDFRSTLNHFGVGIASVMYPICGLTEYPVVATRVESYLQWIVNNIKP